MSSPLISVLLPAYNAADTLPAALESVLVQTLRDFELIVVDDGADDHGETRAVLEAFANKDSRVTPIFRPHEGIVGALNAGLEQAKGRYIARMDADDLCHERRFERQAAYLERNPDVGLASCKVEFGGDREACAGYAWYVDWTNEMLTPEDIALGVFRESPLPHPSVMFRAQLPQEHGAYRDGDFPEDYELWLRWLDAGVRMGKTPETLLTWMDPPGRLSRTDTRYGMEQFYRIKAKYLARWLERSNPHHPKVLLMGSGRTTRKRADMLLEHGVEITAYADIDPRKVGHVVHGRRVIHREEVPGPEKCFALSYVASRGAAEDIAEFLEERGFRLGAGYLLGA